MAEEVAEQKSPEEPAQQVIADNSTEQAEPVAETPTDQQEAVTPAEPTLLDLQQNMQDFMGREQGRLAQESGQRIAAVQRAVDVKLDSLSASMKPLLDQAEAAERERLLNLGQDELAEMVIQQRTATAAPQAQEPLSPYLTALATAGQELITENNLGISIEDPRIWEGWQQGTPVTKSIEIAKNNIERLAGKAPQTVQQSSAQPNPAPASVSPSAPSTQGAPQKSIKTISTLSEAAQLFADGNINPAQYRAAKKQISQGGSATL